MDNLDPDYRPEIKMSCKREVTVQTWSELKNALSLIMTKNELIINVDAGVIKFEDIIKISRNELNYLTKESSKTNQLKVIINGKKDGSTIFDGMLETRLFSLAECKGWQQGDQIFYERVL